MRREREVMKVMEMGKAYINTAWGEGGRKETNDKNGCWRDRGSGVEETHYIMTGSVYR